MCVDVKGVIYTDSAMDYCVMCACIVMFSERHSD